jgi:hypothetical protein
VGSLGLELARGSGVFNMEEFMIKLFVAVGSFVVGILIGSILYRAQSGGEKREYKSCWKNYTKGGGGTIE